MAFFPSLTFTGTRVGGQRERQTQAFETGTPCFPRDYPSSSGYDTYASAREQEEKAKWERKPPAKRPNFEKLETRSPWRADWEVVLGLKSADVAREEEAGFVTTQREEPIVEEDQGTKTIGPWLLRGSEVPNILSSVSKLFNHAAGLLQEINRLRLKRGCDPLDGSIKADELLKAALVSVRVKMCKRGAPDDLALIYSMTDDESKKWEKALPKRRSNGVAINEETPEEVEVGGLDKRLAKHIAYNTDAAFKNQISTVLNYRVCNNWALFTFSGRRFCDWCYPGSSITRTAGAESQVSPMCPIIVFSFFNESRLYLNTTYKAPPLLVKVRNSNTQQSRAAHVELLDN